MLLCVLPLLCGFRSGILAPLVLVGAAMWQPPAAKEGQGDCEFPLGPPWILGYPLKRRRSAGGLEAAERRVLTRRSGVVAKVRQVALRSSVALRLSQRHSCAAGACWRSLVAASGGQGGIGGLRVPPTPSLDSLLTPLYRRRSAMGMEAAERRVLTRRSALLQRVSGVAPRSPDAFRHRGGLAPHYARTQLRPGDIVAWAKHVAGAQHPPQSTRSARMALSIASISTPTSANTAMRMPARPTAPSTSITPFTASASTMF